MYSTLLPYLAMKIEYHNLYTHFIFITSFYQKVVRWEIIR
jgi:hypothetical protein